ncbi:hypothetical protein NIES4072_09620 [Nostoc commune NIES-4072]|uniref:Uncharacterized protein n=1 Tax=Nostoc commune NIES-4072 TaxID=2005467 RepID=A0A2R5FM38_NOSCO|nr:hypothetical protein NIES4070_17210 [Nostoc commune HK-02]GBG17313.1 hypothetical protein NIES4072_09620 [Nostoc commune NIES-4072]
MQGDRLKWHHTISDRNRQKDANYQDLGFVFKIFCKAIALLGIKADAAFNLMDKILSAIFKVYQLLPHSIQKHP